MRNNYFIRKFAPTKVTRHTVLYTSNQNTALDLKVPAVYIIIPLHANLRHCIATHSDS